MVYFFSILAGMLFSVNLFSVIFLIIDKRFALKGYSRIPEKYLFTLALMGGWVFGLLIIKSIRHKNRKKEFLVKYYFCLILSIIIFISLTYLLFEIYNI